MTGDLSNKLNDELSTLMEKRIKNRTEEYVKGAVDVVVREVIKEIRRNLIVKLIPREDTFGFNVELEFKVDQGFPSWDENNPEKGR